MSPRTVAVGARRTINMHAYLQSAARYALKNAEASEEGQTFNLIHCIVASAFCMEAYLNFVGERKVANWQTMERCLAPTEKLTVVTTTLGMPSFKGGKLYHSFQKASRFRNLLAHWRTETVHGSWIEREDIEGPRRQPEAEWEKLCNLKSARRILGDIEALAREIHKAAGYTQDPFWSLGHGGQSRRLRESS
jgi:hypothetical protein